jgi:hypothetical protein
MEKFKEADVNSKVFNFFTYLFLIDITIKSVILHSEYDERKRSQVFCHLHKYMYSKGIGDQFTDPSDVQHLFPEGVKIVRADDTGRLTCHLEIKVTRERLLYDLLSALDKIMQRDIESLKLPLR